jgi:hypothetical protein
MVRLGEEIEGVSKSFDLLSRSGGTGRRGGLKIRSPLPGGEGSTPSFGIS